MGNSLPAVLSLPDVCAVLRDDCAVLTLRTPGSLTIYWALLRGGAGQFARGGLLDRLAIVILAVHRLPTLPIPVVKFSPSLRFSSNIAGTVELVDRSTIYSLRSLLERSAPGIRLSAVRFRRAGEVLDP